jgi:hypothetical protein
MYLSLINPKKELTMSEFDQFVSALTRLLYLIPLLFAFLILYGGALAAGMILTTACAYPTYAALYTLEMFVPFLKLNRPKTIGKKFGMNLLASFCFLFTALIVLRIYEGVPHFGMDVFLEKVKTGEIDLLPACSVVVGNLLLIYLISYFSEPDKRDPLEKLEDLAVPPLVKKITGIP